MNQTDILDVLLKKYQAEYNAIICNIDIYTLNARSIPEHVQYLASLDELVTQAAEIRDKIEVVQSLLLKDLP